MFPLISLLVVIATAQSPTKPYYDTEDSENLFKEFLQEHSKVYNSEEYLTRHDIFKENLEIINEHNAKYPQYEVGINRFTDLTSEERRQYAGFKRFDAASHERVVRLEYPAEAVTAPEQFDWRDRNVVTHVKDQGRCQASWVFAATGNIEGQYALKHKKLIALSEQQALDCMFGVTPKHSNCIEAFPHDVMSHYESLAFLGKNAGIAPESEYPYTGKTGYVWDNCRTKFPNRNISSVTTVTAFNIVLPKDEEALKQYLYETGPLAVGFDSSELFEYTKGIYDPHWCNYGIDHSALLVGYGIENGTKYWTLKNSWGEGWGEKGYFRLIRGKKACDMGVAYTATTIVT